MNKKIVISLYLPIILATNIIFANDDQPGGFSLPSKGNLNILIIFAQFPDDTFLAENKFWPAGGKPSDMYKWVESKWTDKPQKGYLTHYFNDMSFNKLRVTGKEIAVTAPHTRQWYLDNKKNRAFIQKEVILTVDKEIDFSGFDNWGRKKDFVVINSPDRQVDLIIMIWRNISSELEQTKRDSLEELLNFTHNFGGLGGGSFPVDDSLRFINMNDFGSGVTIRDYVDTYTNNTPKQLFRIVIHEFAHQLIGHNSYHSGYGFWGMLSSWGIKSIVANSFEKHRLGWITCKTFYKSDSLINKNLQLADYATTGESIRFVIDSARGEYFYLENHQSISYWEKEFAIGKVEPGLYVLRKDAVTTTTAADLPNSAYFRMIPADGRYAWEVNMKIKNPWGNKPDSLPVFKKLNADRVNGFHDLEFIPWTWNGKKQNPDVIHFTEEPGNNIKQDIKNSGDGGDAFRPGYNEVFSPWSNPNSQSIAKKETSFGFYLKSISKGICLIDIYIKTAAAAPPSKPAGISLEFKLDGNKIVPLLTWEPNIEPDLSLTSKTYFIERSEDNKFYKEIAVTGAGKQNYADYTASTGEMYYRIKVRDTSGLYSVYSDVCSIKMPQK